MLARCGRCGSAPAIAQLDGLSRDVEVHRCGRTREDWSALGRHLPGRSFRPHRKKERTACTCLAGGKEATRRPSALAANRDRAREKRDQAAWSITRSGRAVAIKQRYTCTKLKFRGTQLRSAVAPETDRRQSNCRTCSKYSSLAGRGTGRPCDDRAPAHFRRKSARLS